ncbi:MAG TPA: WYL domain-containing protein [Candidatus Baltobacteraceae bacterium]|nr:WYL domain-containing protein [Candidatus Baltobacteraceae bacterium]
MERTNEPKIVLLVRLLNAIDEGRFSFEQLKDRIAEGEHKPSTRSLRRYLAVLADAGFPWYFDRATNTYRFSEGYSLKRLELSSSELFGLVALRAISASLKGAIGTYVDEVTAKIVGSSGGAAKEKLQAAAPSVAFRLSEVALDDEGERIFTQLSSAERNSRSVRFEYQDKEGNTSVRTADPYGFVVGGGRVYCIAHDRDRRSMRTFAVDNMRDLTVLAQTFTKPQSFNVEDFAGSSISGVLGGGGATTEVRVRFAPRVAKAAIAARVVADRAVTRLADGSVEIAYAVADLDELTRWVLGWGAQAEIVAPPEARGRIQLLISEIATKYELPVSR